MGVVSMAGRRAGAAVLVASAARHGPVVLAVVFCGLGLWSARALWWSVIAPPPLLPATHGEAADRRPALVADASLIASRHLFGDAAASQTDAPAPPTRAALVLGGVWYTPDGDAYALIGEPGGAQKPYRTGNRLPGGVELAGVEADRVLLRREGKVETLALPRAAAVPKPKPVPATRRAH